MSTRLAAALLVVAACGRKDAPEGPAPKATPSVSASTAGAVTSAPTDKPWPDKSAVDTITRASDDAGPPVVTSGKVDGAALRARVHARLDHDTSQVTVLQGDDPKTLGARLCEAVVPARPKGTPVLLKPNLGGFDWFKDPKVSGGDDGVRGRITDPEFVRGVIQCLKKRGHTKITVAEGWGATHADWERLVKVSGYAAMTAEEGVPLVAMDDDGVFDVMEGEPGKPLAVSGMDKTRVPTLLVPKILAEHLDHGLFISLPKIKSHRFGVFSAGLKGVQGTIMMSDASPAFRQKARMHRELNGWLKTGAGDRAAYVAALEAFGERIADVLEVEAPDVVLADGTPGMMGDGFQKLFPTKEKVGVGGVNVVKVDRVVAQVLGVWDNAALAAELGGHRTSPLLTIAAKRFGTDLSAVELAGDGAPLLTGPRPARYISMAGFELGGPSKPAPVDRPVAHAAHLTSAPTLDGSGKDAAWAKATPVSFDTDYAGKATPHLTRAWFLWRRGGGDDGALYAAFDVQGTDLHVDTSFPTDKKRPKLYQEDCVELFLDPTPATKGQYYEIEVGPRGHFFDLALDHKKADLDWSARLQVASRPDPAARTSRIELSISAPEIVRALVAGARLPLGLYRMEGKGKRAYLAWSPPRTEKPDFHVPDAFGVLVLDP